MLNDATAKDIVKPMRTPISYRCIRTSYCYLTNFRGHEKRQGGWHFFYSVTQAVVIARLPKTETGRAVIAIDGVTPKPEWKSYHATCDTCRGMRRYSHA